MRPTLNKIALTAALSTLLALASAPALAAPAQSATDAIRKANDRLRELLSQKAEEPVAKDKVHQQITHELRGLLDIGFLAERALVDHWAKMTAQQRTQVQDTLRAIVEKNYLNQLRGNLDYTTEFAAEEKQESDVLVKTIIHAKKNGRASKILVDYRLRAEGDQWHIFDIITEDVSILANYRGQFNRIIAKDGVDGLIAKMKAKLDKPDKADDKPDDKAAKPDDKAAKTAKPAK